MPTKEEEKRLFRVTAKHYVAGVVFSLVTRKCIEAAPILKWVLGWDFYDFRNYCKAKGLRLEKIDGQLYQ